MKKFLIALSIVLLSATCAPAFEMFEPFGYLWLYGADHQTNFERDDFNSTVLRGEGKLGVNLLPLWGKTGLQAYGAYYGVTSSDLHSWNNNAITGVGLQIMPLLGLEWVGWLQDLKLFYETLSIKYSSTDDEDINDVPDNNFDKDDRWGFDLWTEWNQPGQSKVENRSLLWAELWAHASYRRTNFNWEDFDTYIAYFQPRAGIYLFKVGTMSFEPYLKADLTFSGKDYPFLNNIVAGAGLRVRPFLVGEINGVDMSFLRKFRLFIEADSISYLKDQYDVTSDFRIGFDFSFGR